jgi:hypothetical protein
MTAYDYRVISDFRTLENVSRSHKKYIIQVDIKNINHSKKAARQLLKKEEIPGKSLTFEYKPNSFGFRLGYEESSNDSTRQLGISVSEEQTHYSGGIGYHWFPVTAYLSRWSQLHTSLFLDVISGRASYKITDGLVSIADKSRLSGIQASGDVHLPIVHNIWVQFGIQGRYVRYLYRDINIRIDEIEKIYSIGGGYAF